MKARKARPKKSAKVKAERGFSPEEVVLNGEHIINKINHNHPGQELELYWFENYVWVVPVDTATGELKTAYKSRKYKKEYGR